jgi:hypothetical protein
MRIAVRLHAPLVYVCLYKRACVCVCIYARLCQSSFRGISACNSQQGPDIMYIQYT